MNIGHYKYLNSWSITISARSMICTIAAMTALGDYKILIHPPEFIKHLIYYNKFFLKFFN